MGNGKRSSFGGTGWKYRVWRQKRGDQRDHHLRISSRFTDFDQEKRVMAANPTTAKQYLDSLPEDRRAAIKAVRATINRALPRGYKEGIQYGMLGWFVPHSIFPAGYHCDPKQPVPFVGLASQKNYMSLYLMCIYSDEKDRARFEKEWAKSGKKLNMGKSCVRFKKLEDIPLDVIADAIARVPVEKLLAMYEGATSGGAKKTASKKSASKKTAPKKKKAAKKKAAKKK
jgi:hypothetical protein